MRVLEVKGLGSSVKGNSRPKKGSFSAGARSQDYSVWGSTARVSPFMEIITSNAYSRENYGILVCQIHAEPLDDWLAC